MKSTAWIAPPPEQIITTGKLMRGEIAGTGPDLEQSISARGKETVSPANTRHTE